MTSVATPSATALLTVSEIAKSFGGVRALQGVSFSIQRGPVQSVIGPNGAGKTSLFNVITGLYPADRGSVLFDGEHSIAGPGAGSVSPDRITRLGISRTFQGIRLFRSLSVLDNLLIGAHLQHRTSLVDVLLRSKRFRQERQLREAAARELLALVGLETRAAERSGSLSYGEQRRLEIARALASRPRLLLLDEPAAGMNPGETADLMELIHTIQGLGVTVVLIEHDMKLVMEISTRIFVLDRGELLAEGTPDEVRSNPQVIAAYLGDSPTRSASA